ncbi:hypothetical protein [Pusillimonas sp. ANT_WB101]|uniref:hypothetical protein n=1 Tax=Pusillimonas sp. ANT_WB101 TaxID=2597356 RepID=UPI0011EF2C25|nr:hypothetical protein [Pusillimonas sp. ANT_WB101]KAA0911152.1 hypothetical protein FQ179_04690 [Pusillimonas sp. ANT_WB101]
MQVTSSSLNVSGTSTDWRGVALSNFSLSPFVLDDILLASIEGFIQGIKFPETDPRRAIAFCSSGWDAKSLASQADRRAVYWAGISITYGSAEHHQLIGRAICARIEQSIGLQKVLISTEGLTLIHETGSEPESSTTSLPATVFCKIMTDLREKLLLMHRQG